jgi:hypothetical protein
MSLASAGNDTVITQFSSPVRACYASCPGLWFDVLVGASFTISDV